MMLLINTVTVSIHHADMSHFVFFCYLLLFQFVYMVLKCMKVLPENTELSQIHVILRVLNVPALPGYVIHINVHRRVPLIFSCSFLFHPKQALTPKPCTLKHKTIPPSHGRK